jgi:hypothetical protein
MVRHNTQTDKRQKKSDTYRSIEKNAATHSLERDREMASWNYRMSLWEDKLGGMS